MRRPKVLIAGGGISGLAAAEKLKKQADVTLLEARDRLGGRLHTHRSWAFPFDAGAQVIHGAWGNPLSTLVRRLGLRTRPSDYEDVVLYEKGRRIRPQVKETQQKKFYAILKSIQKQNRRFPKERTLADALIAVREKTELRPALWEWFLASEVIYSGADFERHAARFYDQSNDYRGPSLIFPDGYDEILRAVELEGVDVRLECPIRKIAWGRGGVSAETPEGIFEADYALITLPLGVLKSRSVHFDPFLPDWKQGAIDRLDMGVLNMIFMRFKKIFWPSRHDFIGVVGLDNPFTRFAVRNRWQKAPVLTGVAGGDRAAAIEGMPDEEITALARQALAQALGCEVPPPEQAAVTRWAGDPYSRGSYSFIPAGASRSDYNLLARSVGQRLFFAGEATNIRHPCTVHGAYLSGQREARHIQACFKGGC